MRRWHPVSVFVALTVVSSAAPAARLDDWLSALGPDPDTVVIVPRLASVTEPLGQAATRLGAHPALRRVLAPQFEALAGGLGLPILDPGALDTAGIDADGPVVVAAKAGAVRAVLVPVRDAAAAPGVLRRLSGLLAADDAAVRPATVGGREGWRLGPWWAALDGRELVVAASEAGVSDLVESVPDPGARPLAGCPRGKGEADLFVRHRPAAACITARFDPDRVRLDGRLGREGLPLGWLPAADERFFAIVGDDPAAVIRAGVGPATAETLRAGLKRRLPAAARGRGAALVDALAGTAVFAAGPAPTDLTLAARLRPGRDADAREALAGVAKALGARPGLRVAPDGDGVWRVRIPTPPDWPASLPRVEAGWLAVRDGFVQATTRRAVATGPTGDLRRALRGRRGAVDAGLLDRAALLLYVRLAGRPLTGRALADQPRVREVAGVLGVSRDDLEAALSAVAYVLGHIGEVALTVRPRGDAVDVAFEWVTL